MEKKEAQRFGVPVFETLYHFPLIQEKKAIVPYLFAKQKTILPLEEKEEKVIVAIADPLDLDSLAELRLFFRKTIVPIYATKSLIEEAIEHCYQQKEEETQRLFSDLEKEGDQVKPIDSEEEYDLLEKLDENPVIRLVDSLFIEAIQQRASDIHFEPTEEGLAVRYRVDGVLLKKHTPPKEYQQQILTRIKVMSKLDIAEQRLPQDGRIKLRYGGREIDFRVSTLPMIYGERIVLRILDKGNIVLGIDRIGMPLVELKLFRKLIQMSEGIVLVTGPTGSGKTTTLYSALSEINALEMNIMTIEDPVEYKISGISQMNVNRRIELDFSKGLRHILRQDPDVIMIGEIRDKETAEIAIQSSLTGHLVLSTLHTNDAPSALTRLADMGIEPYLLASSILGVLAQRLVRKICPDCKISYAASIEEKEDLDFPIEEELILWKGQGCPQCYGTGFRSRHAIYELMLVDAKIKAQVLKSQDAVDLRKIAIEQGMQTLFQQGVALVMQGLTTIAEVLRVTRNVEEE